MDAEQLKKLKSLALTVKNHRSELKSSEYKLIEQSEFHAESSPETILALIEELADARDSAEFYKRRVDLLQHWQSRMRDPERAIACDIIANGQTLPSEHAGDRYKIPSDASKITIDEQALEIQKLNNDIKQMAADLRVVQEIHDHQKARMYSENSMWKSSLAALRQELEEGAKRLEKAKENEQVAMPDWVVPRVTEIEARLTQLTQVLNQGDTLLIPLRNCAVQISSVRRTLARNGDPHQQKQQDEDSEAGDSVRIQSQIQGNSA